MYLLNCCRNKCPDNYSDRRDRKKRATADVKLPTVNANSKLPNITSVLSTSPVAPLINIVANTSNATLTAASRSVATGGSVASNMGKVVSNTTKPITPQQISEMMSDCQPKLDDMVAQKVFSCVFSTNVTLAGKCSKIATKDLRINPAFF